MGMGRGSVITTMLNSLGNAPSKTYRLEQGADWGWVKYYTKNGRRKVQIGVCDMESDMNTVYGEFF